MHKKLLITYCLIFFIILTLMSLSRHTSDKVRGQSVSFLAPFWEKIIAFKSLLLHQSSDYPSFPAKENLKSLQLENQLLENEIANLQRLITEQITLSHQIDKIASLSPKTENVVTLVDDYQKFVHRTFDNLRKQTQAIPAQVIFRSFDTWNSSLWINVGEATNDLHQSRLVAVNSPVVVGRAIVGILDYVGKHQSRVRLITDHRLRPSVRAARGGEQDFLLGEKIESILLQLERQKNLPLSPDDGKHLSELLTRLKKGLQPYKKSWYLAKGELQGSISPSNFSYLTYLRGTGFNFDFSDEEGESRDLRSGKSSINPQEPTINILKVNDVLVTTGLDGIFPPGFQIALISHVELLKEGDYYYDLKAIPIAGPFEELSSVFVLPPVSEESVLISLEKKS